MSGGHVHQNRFPGQVGKRLRIGSTYPNLPAQSVQKREKSVPASRVKMSGDLVQKGQWRYAAHHFYELCMRQRQSNQERFLLAGGALRGRHALGTMLHVKIARLRANQSSPGGCVAPPVLPQQPSIGVFGLKRWLFLYQAVYLPL
jgi:hypothetical protein